MLLYVINEYPSTSETFVAGEIGAMARRGVPVKAYALRMGDAATPSTDLPLVASPPSRAVLLATALRSPMITWRALVRAAHRRLAPREAIRAALAELHARRVLRACQHEPVNHVHAHFLGRTADVASAVAWWRGCRWSVTAHASDAYANAEPGLQRSRLASVALVVCASNAVQLAISAGRASSPLNTTTIRCGVDTEQLIWQDVEYGEPARLITVARLVRKKGHHVIVKSLEQLASRGIVLEWLVVGDGPMREELETCVDAAGLTDTVTFVGARSHGEALSLLRTATIFALPSVRGPNGDLDGIPVAMMEAMALGVPVITTNVGGIGELVVHDETGFVVPPNNPEALADTIAGCGDRRQWDHAKTLARTARRRIELEYTLERQARDLQSALSCYGVECQEAG